MEEQRLQAHYSSLTGTWVLDVARSDPLDSYFRLLLDNPEAAIQAQAAGERTTQSRNVIVLDESELILHKRTIANDYTESFILGEDKFAQNGSGGYKRSRASLINNGLAGYLVANSSVSPQAGRNFSLVDARRLADGGHLHVQELSARNNTTGAQCTIMRTWVRVPMTRTDLERVGRLPAE